VKKFVLQRKMVDDEEKFVNEVSKVITYSQLLELNDIARISPGNFINAENMINKKTA